jgi:ABC-type polysaccharide/polyol phosphate transport system ATPase subunit
MSDRVIEIDHVWKKYPSQRDRPGFKEFFVNFPKWIKRQAKGDGHFHALRDVTLRIDRGESVGIIGKNGAGKSTLLSLMLGTILPSQGRANIMDRVTPLLELGGGFHPDLTGRENVILNGVLLGLTREDILQKISSIVAFSEMGEFVDVPVRTYSTGMYVRLAFSVAIHTDPRILIIDEVLSVGDEGFQKKSKDAMLRLIKGGVTTVLVSHNLQAIEEICDRAIWLDHGEVAAEGKPGAVIGEYRKSVAPNG